MSYIPFSDPNVAAATLSNLAVYKKQITIASSGALPELFSLFTTETHMGKFAPVGVWFHVDDNSGNNQLQFTAGVGSDPTTTLYPTAYSDICDSVTRGTTGATASLQLRQYKAVVFPIRATGATTSRSLVAPGGTVYMRLSLRPTAQVTGTFFITGFYTGMRP